MAKSVCKIIFDPVPHKYYLDGEIIPSVSEILKYGGITGDYSYVDPKYLIRGTYVHEATEKIDVGSFSYEGVPGDYLPFIIAYDKFLEENETEMISTEKMLFNKDLIYCGTSDRIMMVNGRKFLVDYKTGLYSKWHKAQLTLYNLALVSMGVVEEPLPIANLYIRKDGTYEFKEYPEPMPYEEVVRAALLLYWYKRETDGKRIKKVIKTYA